MDLRKHYESYKESVSAWAPENYIEYARITPTQNPRDYPTIYDYVMQLVTAIRSALDRNDASTYRGHLIKHQFAMRALFYKMSRELLTELGLDPDNVSVENMGKYEKEFGRRWVEALDKSVREVQNGDIVTDWRGHLM